MYICTVECQQLKTTPGFWLPQSYSLVKGFHNLTIAVVLSTVVCFDSVLNIYSFVAGYKSNDTNVVISVCSKWKYGTHVTTGSNVSIIRTLYHNSFVGSSMVRTLLLALLLLSPTALLSATAKTERCPDPACCRPSRGPTSCAIDLYPCWAKCSRNCPCGAVYCSIVERYWPVCQVGEPLGDWDACVIRDQLCDEFLAQFDPCNDPCCWDIDLLNLVCGPACNE